MLLKNLWDILKETREKNILQILHTGIWLFKKISNPSILNIFWPKFL